MDLNKELPLRLILLLSLLSFPALAQTQLYFEESQALTRDAPTTSPVALPASASKPLKLNGFTHFRLTVCPETGQSLAGGGTIRLYLFVPVIGTTGGMWAFNAALDVAVGATTTNKCWTKGFKIDIPQGYLLPATQSVTVSGGSTVVVHVDLASI